MTKSRSSLLSLAGAAAFAFLAAPTPAAAETYSFGFDSLKPNLTPGAAAQDDLPAPPKLAAPNAEPKRARPPMVTMTWGSNLPVFKKPATPPASLKSLKSK